METTTKSASADREIRIGRLLNAPIELVWEVWTNPDHIKNWWGPNGFTNTISKMDIKPEGEWDLVMHGPDGTDYRNKSIFKEVVKHKKLVYEHVTGPKFTATITFKAEGDKTQLDWHMLFNSKEEFIQTVKTFKADEGLKQNVEKLDLYLQTRIELHRQSKTNTKTRVTTYLNFPGNTEEAMTFYKTVFKGEFTGRGLLHFADADLPKEHPPLDEATKKLVLFAELTILGGHVLMATDAPESMGFKLQSGNNMHINLEPDSKAEAQRLFDELSKGGKVTMPMQDMFFGAFFGEFTDKYGINWMITYTYR